jgi:hypothetical protein
MRGLGIGYFKTLGDCIQPGKMGIMLGSSPQTSVIEKECFISWEGAGIVVDSQEARS